MPFVRNRILPEVTSTGKIKRTFGVLIWCNSWSKHNALDLDAVEILRSYLWSLKPEVCTVDLFVPAHHTDIIHHLKALGILFQLINARQASADTKKLIADQDLAACADTALACDADAIAVTKPEWFPYIEDIETLGLSLTDTSFLKHYCKAFVRGHDVPWEFSSPTWNLTWTGFYQMTEARTFRSGMDFLFIAQEKKVSASARETGRSFVYNRLANISFTRDRLLFYELQRLKAVRAKWQRQEFKFEIAYYLNFYYLLVFGGFDHLALLVSQALALGLPDRSVGATYKSFLDRLKTKAPMLHAVFTDTKHVEFIKRIGALRHYAAHRGSLAPAKVLQEPDKELSNDELDAEIAATGKDKFLEFMPVGKVRNGFRDMLRYNVKMAHYEKAGIIIDGAVPVEIDGKFGFIQPAVDTAWNFNKFMVFTDQVFVELGKFIS